MRNKLFEQALSLVPEKTKQKIKKYTDMIDKIEELQLPFVKTDMIFEVIQEAYKLYMPQVESEITDLAKFVQNDIFNKRENDPFYQYNILEIGTKYGGTFYIWNKLNELTNGLNISIDMSDGGLHGGINDEDMNKRDLWFNERFNNCHFIRGDSHSAATRTKFIKLFDLTATKPFPEVIGECIDFIFIDGDHSYEGVKQDFLDYSPFCKPKSIIAFHDIIDSQRHRDRNVYVAKFWKDLTKVRNSENPNQCMIDGNWYEIHEFIEPEKDWAGIGILIKI